ncbi:MAG: dTMP kinase, partial [Nannocystaceae bacterium]
MSTRGLMIALEGIDGSGTTSQARALASALRAQGYEVVVTCEPTKRRIGSLIRQALANDQLDPAALALLFAADRIDHLAGEIGPAVARGAIVICDRYLMSSLVYQALDCDLGWIRTINRFATPPDLYLCIELPVEVAFARVQ